MKRIIIPCLACLLLASCAVYAPQTADIPHFTQQGDLQGSLAFDGGSSALVLQGAGAVTDHIGVMVSGTIPLDKSQPFVGNQRVRPAVGYYHTWLDKMMLGGYVGADWGSRNYATFNANHDMEKQYRFHTTTLFGQVDFVWSPATWFDLCARLSMGNLHYNGTYTTTDLDGNSNTRDYLGNNLLIEPTLQRRFGAKNLKFYLSASYVEIPHFNNEGIYYHPYTVGIGLNYRFNPFRK